MPLCFDVLADGQSADTTYQTYHMFAEKAFARYQDKAPAEIVVERISDGLTDKSG
jgi:hypothetical protein